MDEIDSVNSVDELQSHGIGQTDIKKLKSAGWYYVQDLFSQPRRALVVIKGSWRLIIVGFHAAKPFHLDRSMLSNSNHSASHDRIPGHHR